MKSVSYEKPLKPSMSQRPVRIDDLLVLRGIASSHLNAKALLLTGNILVGDQVVSRVDFTVKDPSALRIRLKDRPFVSRAGVKLNGALQDMKWHRSLEGMKVLDVGASTGGFTDCCLRLGAKQVTCVDVGTNQLAWSLREDPRVEVFEKTDIRFFTPPGEPVYDLVVADLSFISLWKILPKVLSFASSGTKVALLIKPQFEVPKNQVPKGGIVKDQILVKEVCQRFKEKLTAEGFGNVRYLPSRLAGAKGNQEFFILGSKL